MAASKVVHEPDIDVEVGEIPASPSRPDEPKKKARTFEQGSTSHPPTKEMPVKPVYRSTYDNQFRGYTYYHTVNHRSKAPIIPETEASLAVLKKISMYGLDMLIAEVAQNLENVRFPDFLFYMPWFLTLSFFSLIIYTRVGLLLSPESKITHTILDEISYLKSKHLKLGSWSLGMPTPSFFIRIKRIRQILDVSKPGSRSWRK